MFRACNEKNLRLVACRMERFSFKKGDVLMKQGQAQENILVVTQGTIVRVRFEEGRNHYTETLGNKESYNTLGALHVLRGEPCYGTVTCKSDIIAYSLSADELHALLRVPDLATDIVYALSREIREISKAQITPILEQEPATLAVGATSIAAAIESVYRSALNAKLNEALSGQKGPLFPNMHIQLPTRVLYINGFKMLRSGLHDAVKPELYSNPDSVRLGLACVPGICMTPVSSVLEACNAGHSNPEPLQLRAMRGLVPRAMREVIFGLGINQMSDWYGLPYLCITRSIDLLRCSKCRNRGACF